MPGEVLDDRVVVREQAEANRLYNKGWFGRPRSGGSLDLDFVEAAYLLDAGRLTIRDAAGADGTRFHAAAAAREPGFEIRYLVYRDLRDRGLSPQVAAPAQRARGIDFLLPPSGATSPKARSTIVQARSERKPVTSDELAAAVQEARREGLTVRVAVVDEESEVTTYDVDTADPRGQTRAETGREAPADLLVDRVLVPDAAAAERLHAREFFGKPVAGALHLSLVEALHLSRRGVLTVRDPETQKAIPAASLLRQAKKIEPGIEARLRVFDDLKARELVVKTGYKFGAHFRAYERDPTSTHAPLLIHVHPGGEALEWSQVARAVRLAHGVRKTLVFATPRPDAVRYLRLSWVR